MTQPGAATKTNQILTILAVALLGALLGMCLLFGLRFYLDEAKKDRISAAGVITPDIVGAIDKDEMDFLELGQVRVYAADGSEVEADAVEFLLNSAALSKYSEDGAGEIEIFILPSLTVDQMINDYGEGNKFAVMDATFVSGNFVYLTEDFSRTIPRPAAAYQNLFAGVVYADSFNQLSAEELQTAIDQSQHYNFKTNELVREFVALTEGDIDNWQEPYPNKIKELETYSDVCVKPEEPLQLLICELSVYQTGNADKLPPASQKFIAENFEIQTNAQQEALGTNSSTDVLDAISGLGLKEAKVKFSAWDVAEFTSDIYALSGKQVYFESVSESELTDLRTRLEQAGWELVEETKPVNDDQFDFATRKLVFNRENPLLKTQLSLLIMDTKTMKVDCIIEGIGVVYCDQQASIYKNNDNYIQLSVGQFARYQVDE